MVLNRGFLSLGFDRAPQHHSAIDRDEDFLHDDTETVRQTLADGRDPTEASGLTPTAQRK